MKNTFTTTAIVIAMGLSAGASFAAQSKLPAAGEAPFAQTDSVVTTTTRAAVKADYLQAQKAGTLPYKSDSVVVPEATVTSTLTRAAVKAELEHAQKTGTMPATGDRS